MKLAWVFLRNVGLFLRGWYIYRLSIYKKNRLVETPHKVHVFYPYLFYSMTFSKTDNVELYSHAYK